MMKAYLLDVDAFVRDLDEIELMEAIARKVLDQAVFWREQGDHDMAEIELKLYRKIRAVVESTQSMEGAYIPDPR